jgi:hypothetical protein
MPSRLPLSGRAHYYSEGDRIRGECRLAQDWGLHGEVQEEHFQRLANWQHPLTEEQLVRHQTAREYVNARGETVSTMEHRAAWDAQGAIRAIGLNRQARIQVNFGSSVGCPTYPMPLR